MTIYCMFVSFCGAHWCVCVWGGGGSVLFSTKLHSASPCGDPGQLSQCNSRLKLIAVHFLENVFFESRVPLDGITQFSQGVFSCGGFAHLSG